MQVSVANAMYEYAKSWPSKQYKTISPSSLGGCMRAHYYRLTAIQPTTPPNPGAQLNFELGRLWETQVAKGLRHKSVPFMDQLYLYDKELNMGGTLDFAIFHTDTSEWEVVDSKTESVYSEGYRKRGGETFVSSNKAYSIQLMAYVLLMEAQGFKVKNRARFVVITKDNGMLNEPVVMLTDRLRNETLDRISRLNKHLAEGTVPACECEGWKIGYCNYGNPNTVVPNSKKKLINSECCGTPEQIKEWGKEKQHDRQD